MRSKYIRLAKGSIGRRITSIIVSSVVAAMLLSGILTYFFGTPILIGVLGKEYSQIAKTLNVYIMSALNGEIEDSISYATRPLWRDSIKESNLRYQGMDAESIKQKLLDMDKRWIAAKPGDPILKAYLENRISLGMEELLRVRTKLSEISITDKYGGLVSSSGKTADFCQADELWWQKAYDGGKGGIYVSDIEFDESSTSRVISIAVPIRDSESGEVIGICKNSVGLEKLFGNLADFRLGNTGNAILLDNNGTLLFHHGVSEMNEKMFSEKALRKMLAMKNSYMIFKNFPLHNNGAFVAFNEVRPPYLSDRGISWIVLVAQDLPEVYAPIYNFVICIAAIALLMTILIIPLGYYFSNLIARPIYELNLATERVMSGDWDYKIDVKTGDEIEQFANTFRDMIADIKNKQKELQSFSNGLETKVEERTKELSEAREAALNILEDLQVSKEALERTNKDLMKLDELKSDFISTVSHELRTPLSIIKEGISLVLDKIPGEINEKQSKILGISKYNIDRLARIIDDLLDISKIDSGKMELKRSLISISDIVRRVASSFELKIKEKGLEMRLDVDSVTGNIWADPDKITQVLTNLIGNAVKFTQSGHIDISCKDKGDGAVCSVSDTGVGISKEDIPKVFDKFQQFGRVAGPGDKGTGLGLSIAKSIVDMHNGVIWVESEFAKGTKFTFKLHKYTPQSLFREYVSKAVKTASGKGSEVSIIAVNASLTGKDASGDVGKKFDDIMHESVRLIKSSLKNEEDDLVNNGGEMIVILADCDKRNAVKVQSRLEEVIGKHLAGVKANDAIRISYRCLTYPGDANSELELIEKVKSALTVSTKA